MEDLEAPPAGAEPRARTAREIETAPAGARRRLDQFGLMSSETTFQRPPRRCERHEASLPRSGKRVAAVDRENGRVFIDFVLYFVAEKAIDLDASSSRGSCTVIVA